MAQPARTQRLISPGPTSRPASATLLNGVRQTLGVFLSAVGLAWLGRLLVVRDPVQGAWALQVMLSLAALLSGSWGAAHRYRTWTLPMRRLQQLLAEARDGD